MNFDLESVFLKKLASGDHDAFHSIFVKYFSKTRFFISSIIKSDAVAEELAQDVFVKIWVNREELPELKSFSSYLYRIAKNTAINYLNRRYLEEKYIQTQTVIDEKYVSIEEDMYVKDIELLVQLVVDTMPPQRKRIFEMSRHENIDNNEIALRLNISKKTVENHLNLALKEIRKILQDT